MRNRFSIDLWMFVSVSSIAHAATLTQWLLPGGSPLQIDASSSSRRVYFIDQASGTIDELNPAASTLTWWPAPFTATEPGGIVVDTLAMPRFVYVTDLLANILGQLDLTTNTYFKYYLATLPWGITDGPRQLVYDSTHTVELAGDAIWFSASATAGTPPNPIIGYFSPPSKFRVWRLPATVAMPGDTIDGLAFNLTAGVPSVYFTVNGSANSVGVLLPLINQVNFWQLSAAYSRPAPIVATTAGDVFRVQCAGCGTVARISTSTGVLDEWSSNDLTDLYVTLDPMSLAPRFTAISGGAPTADLLITPCPMNTTPLAFGSDTANPDLDFIGSDPTPAPPTVIGVPQVTSPLTLSPICPFFGLAPIGSGGPISADVAAATWISETSTSAIATF